MKENDAVLKGVAEEPQRETGRPGTISDVVAFNVRIERARRRWNQGQLGDFMGLSRSGVSELEAGRRKIQLDEIVLLCRAFGIGFAQLVHGADPGDLAALGLASKGRAARFVRRG